MVFRKLLPREVIPLDLLEIISDRQPIRQIDLGKRAKKCLGTIHVTTKTLEEVGLVTRNKIGREIKYTTTEAGEKLAMAYKELLSQINEVEK